MCLRISAVTAAAAGLMVSLRQATAAKEHLTESLNTPSAHKHITGITGLPCSAPVFNHYIRAHTLSYHLTGTSKEESRKKEKRERRLGRTTQSLNASTHWENEKQHDRKL